MERSVIFCLIPPDLALRLHGPLREHFRADPEVEVVVERRGGDERRRSDERRKGHGPPPARGERRRIRNEGGRRVGDRRAPQAPLEPAGAPELPRRARRFADRISFVERAEPSSERTEDLDTARLVTRIQAGEHDRFADLYLRYFDRVYGYLLVALRDAHEAEELTQATFANAFEAIPRYERSDKPFRAWLFTIVRNLAVSSLRKHSRVQVTDPIDLDEQRDAEAEPVERVLEWVSDRDLLVLIERLPAAQRQVLALRFMFGFSIGEIAGLLDTTSNHISVLQYRALGFLRRRLAAAGREPLPGPRSRSQRTVPQARVLRRRRFALSP